MNTCIYHSRRTFMKYDQKQIIGYLNEKITENYEEKLEDGTTATFTAYQYSGTETDGGTLMQCVGEDRDDIVNAIIRTQYSETQELAILRHHGNDSTTFSQEWEDYNSVCENAKTVATTWLS